MTEDEHVDHLLSLARAAGVFPSSAGGRHMRAVLDTWSANLTLYARTDLPPLTGGCTLVHGTEEDTDILAGWQRAATRPAVHTTDGDHFTMMTFPRIAGLAKLVGTLLDGPDTGDES
jgi:thioesterase domain-containing protein